MDNLEILGGLGKKEGMVFSKGVIPQCPLCGGRGQDKEQNLIKQKINSDQKGTKM